MVLMDSFGLIYTRKVSSFCSYVPYELRYFYVKLQFAEFYVKIFFSVVKCGQEGNMKGRGDVSNMHVVHWMKVSALSANRVTNCCHVTVR